MAKFIKKEECIACGECQRRCPVKAIESKANYYLINQIKCIECEICAETCPENAIGLNEDNKIGKKKNQKVPAGHKVVIDSSMCVSCGLCALKCPKNAITGEKPPLNYEMRDVVKTPFSIDKEKCIRCGICYSWCRIDAIKYVED